MSKITIDYLVNTQDAQITAGDDCSDIQWSAIRRFCEEKWDKLVKNQHRSLTLPWWAFLSIRESLRTVLQYNSITSLETSESAKRNLLKAKERAEQYRQPLQIISLEKIPDLLLSLGFKRSLLPFQLRNVTKLLTFPAAATFSVPGSGKTTEALAYFFLTREMNDKLLVVAPKNAFVAWEDELPSCVPGINFQFVRLTGGALKIRQLLSQDPPAVIISYHQLPKVLGEITAFLTRNPVYIFIDESHRMKRGFDGVHGSAVLSLAHLAKRKLILSGTPMPNTSTDLVPQFLFLYPEISTSSGDIFNNFQHIFVRTTKSELGLPVPYRIIHKVPMSPSQEKLYQMLASDTARNLAGLNLSDRTKFRQVAKCVQYMIQAASNPSLLASSDLAGYDILEQVLSEGISNKLQVACNLTRKWVEEGNKVLIWSTFVKTVEHLSGLLSDVDAQFIHGGVSTSEEDDAVDTRETIIRQFNDPSSECKVLVANPAACSEGISLHKICHRAIYIDRNYNAAQYLQSEDRIHRIGLDPTIDTHIVILCSPNTIDESIDRRLQIKVSNMQNILNDPDLNIRPLDLDDEDDEFEGITADDLEDLRRMLLGRY